MEVEFVPKKLIASKNEIIKRHGEVGDIKVVEPTKELKALILRLVKLTPQSARQEALILTNKEVESVVRYLPRNIFNQKLDNLFQIFLIRVNKKLCKMFFFEWQNAFDNVECNRFVLQQLLSNKFFIEMLNTCNLTEQRFRYILEQKIIPIVYGWEAIHMEATFSQTTREKLLYLGIYENSVLFKQCMFFFYVYCLREDYLNTSVSELQKVLKQYDAAIVKLLLKNFLKELTYTDLKQRRFDSLATFFLDITGDNKTKKFNEYFKDFESILVEKYVDWINTYKIRWIFGNDERSLFWEQYRYEDVRKYMYSNAVVMFFADYVAIEFLGQANGPCYIYTRDYFRSKLEKSAELTRNGNNGLRSFLYNFTSYVNGAKILTGRNGTRLIHLPNPGWQYTFDRVLISYNHITTRLS